MDLDFYVRVRTCKKRVTGKQPLRYLIHMKVSINHYHKGRSSCNYKSVLQPEGH